MSFFKKVLNKDKKNDCSFLFNAERTEDPEMVRLTLTDSGKATFAIRHVLLQLDDLGISEEVDMNRICSNDFIRFCAALFDLGYSPVVEIVPKEESMDLFMPLEFKHDPAFAEIVRASTAS